MRNESCKNIHTYPIGTIFFANSRVPGRSKHWQYHMLGIRPCHVWGSKEPSRCFIDCYCPSGYIYIYQIVYRYRHECITSCVYITLYTYIWNIIVWSYIISYIVHPWNDSRQISQWLVHPFFCSSQAINMGQSSMDTHVETQPISGWWLSLPLWKMMEFVS